MGESDSEDDDEEKGVTVLGLEDTVVSETKRFLWKALCRYKDSHAFLTSDIGRLLLGVCSDRRSILQLLCRKCKRFLQLGAGCTLQRRMPLVKSVGGAKKGGRQSKLTDSDRRRATRLVKTGKARPADYNGEAAPKLRKHEQRLLNRISRQKTAQPIENAFGLRCETCKTFNRLRPIGKKLAGKLRPIAGGMKNFSPFSITTSSTNQNESLLNESTNQNRRRRKKRRTLNAGLNLSGVSCRLTPGSASSSSAAAIGQSATPSRPSASPTPVQCIHYDRRLTPLDVLKRRLNLSSSQTPAPSSSVTSSSTPKFSRNARLESMLVQHGSGSHKKPKSGLSAFLESLR